MYSLQASLLAHFHPFSLAVAAELMITAVVHYTTNEQLLIIWSSTALALHRKLELVWF